MDGYYVMNDPHRSFIPLQEVTKPMMIQKPVNTLTLREPFSLAADVPPTLHWRGEMSVHPCLSNRKKSLIVYDYTSGKCAGWLMPDDLVWVKSYTFADVPVGQLFVYNGNRYYKVGGSNLINAVTRNHDGTATFLETTLVDRV